ncbi:hypothetical protein JD276_01030 [Leucobacter sp. CSA1]|uniref:HTH luxR-type domain-containing protein n=1 Tax=Leucobacter chromiisoli TaxID=2796471 RepID=A0A934UTE0_9MICO|nr:LuxR C-terminal-related transcriptional regulator [Leucobacter chromiisoli]MBK0417620.1 hypothetical protein [Leucobacter chromiisoli]
MAQAAPDDGLLRRLSEVLTTPLGSMVHGLSGLLAPVVRHSALVTLAADIGGGRLQGTGDTSFIRGVRGLDLDRLKQEAASFEGVQRAPIVVDGAERETLQVLSRNGVLLVIADPGPLERPDAVLSLWNIISLHVQERADEATPGYLQHARATAGTRIKALTELSDEYAGLLGELSTTLRSDRLGDREAREAAIALANTGFRRLRAATEQVRSLTEEPVTTAFARLKSELLALTQYRDISLQFVAPPDDGRPLPDEVARGVRAIARRVLLDLAEVPGVTRVRVRWDCDGVNLLMYLRDDGPGTRRMGEVLTRAAEHRVQALAGQLTVEATSGWGTALTIVIPLDPPRASAASSALARLRPREIEVADLLVAGYSNRAIAGQLGISENTVKFHVSRILEKLGAGSRAEVISLVLAQQQT